MNIYILIPLTSCLAYILLIAMTLRYAQRRVRGIFVLYLGVAMLWSLSSFQVHWNHFTEYTLLWHKSLIVLMMTVTVTYYHFVSTFTNRLSVTKLWVGYGFLIVFAFLTFSGYVIKSSQVINGLLYYDIGMWNYLFGIFGTSFMVMAITLLAQYYRHSVDFQVRNRTIYLLAGAIIMLSLALTNLSSFLARYSIDHIGNLINALLISYAILRYRLVDIRVIARRGLAYSVLTIGLTTIYVVIILFSIQRLFHTWTGYSTLAAAGLALLLAIMFQPLRGVIERWVDRLFYRETYDYRQTLLKFSKRMSNILNLDELAENMLYSITKALYSKQAYLLLAESEGGDFVTQFVQPSATKESTATIRLRVDSPIIAWLQRDGKVLNREQIDILPEFKSLWETEKEEFDALELELFCPIRTKGNLIGILVLSKKQSGTPYYSEDIDLLTTMTTGAAVVVENAIILSNLKEQQLRVEQLLTRTVLAQEEERKRISIELHDSVAQWLVSASYRVQACRALLSKTDNSEAQGELAEIEATIDTSLKELRQVMTGLHPPALDELGLVHTLRQALERLKPEGIAYHLDITGEPARLNPSTELAVYRVVQEAIHNVRKHSGASAVVLRLQFAPGNVMAEVSDNGKGFNLTQTMRSAVPVGHMGLLGMKERAAMLGGTLEIKTRHGAGTSICLMLPIASSAASPKADEHNI